MNQSVLKLILTLQDQASSGLRTAQAAVQNLASAAGPMLAGGLLAAGGALVAFGASSVNVAADFGSQMARVAAVSGATSEEMGALRQAAIDMGSSTVFSASEAGAALGELTAGGMNATQAIDALPGTLALAAAGGVDLASAAEITAATLNGFRLSADQAGAVADKLSTVSNISAAGVTDLGESMKYIAPVAAAMGVSIDDTGAALAVLANNGIKGSAAGTALRAIMLGLASPSAEAAKQMQQLGINVFDAQGKMLPLPQVIGAFQKGLGGLTQEQQAAALATIVGREAAGSMMALMAAGEGTIAEYSGKLADSGGAAADMAAKSQTAFDLMKGNIGGAIEQVQIAIGDLLLPILVLLGNQFATVVAGLLPLVASFGAWVGALGASGAPMAALAAQFPILGQAIGVGQAAFTAIAGIVAAVMPQIQSIVSSVLTIVAAFWQQNGAQILTFASGVWTQIQQIISTVVQIVQTIVVGVFTAIATFLQTHGATIVAALTLAWQLMAQVISTALTLIQGILDTAMAILEGDWEGAWMIIEATARTVWNDLVGIVRTAAPALKAAADAGIAAIKGAWDSFAASASSLGKAIIDGIVAGIKSGVGSIIAAAKAAAKAALDAAKSVLRTGSPSKAFEEEVGAMSIAGWVNGIKAGVPALEDAAAGAAKASVAAANTGYSTADVVPGGLLASSPDLQRMLADATQQTDAILANARKTNPSADPGNQARRAVPSGGGAGGGSGAATSAAGGLRRGGSVAGDGSITVNLNVSATSDREFIDKMKRAAKEAVQESATASGIRNRSNP